MAFQLAALVERYDTHVDHLVHQWLDMDCYREVSAEIDEIQLYSSSLPQVAVQAVALLIAHSALIFSLWRNRSSATQSPELQACLRRHRESVEQLHRSCLRLLRGGGTGRLSLA